MLAWPLFQPNKYRASPAHLEHSDTLMDLAAERPLDVGISMLVGFRGTGSAPSSSVTS